MPETLRMNAYYYSFEPTGCYAVDKILSAVATAGKGFHNTEDWSEKWGDGPTCVEVIQEAANSAVNTVEGIEHLSAALAAAHALMDRYNETRGVAVGIAPSEDANIFAEWDALDDALKAMRPQGAAVGYPVR